MKNGILLWVKLSVKFVVPIPVMRSDSHIAPLRPGLQSPEENFYTDIFFEKVGRGCVC